MLDELTIYNLAIKHPNTVDLVREVEKMTIDEFVDKFNKSTIIMGRGCGRTFMLKCLNEIAEQMKGEHTK